MTLWFQYRPRRHDYDLIPNKSTQSNNSKRPSNKEDTFSFNRTIAVCLVMQGQPYARKEKQALVTFQR